MQANVPQPATDEDETDDVDEELKKLQVNIVAKISTTFSNTNCDKGGRKGVEYKCVMVQKKTMFLLTLDDPGGGWRWRLE